MATGTNDKNSVVDYIRQIWNRLGYACATIGTYFRCNNLDTFCIPEYYCDGLTTSNRLLVKQPLHYLALRELLMLL